MIQSKFEKAQTNSYIQKELEELLTDLQEKNEQEVNLLINKFRDKISKEVLEENILIDLVRFPSPKTDQIKKAKLEIAKILVANGAEINPYSYSSSLVLEVVLDENVELLEFLVKKGSSTVIKAHKKFVKFQPIQEAAKKDNFSMVKIFVENGASTSTGKVYHQLSLELTKDPKIVKLLLEYGSPIGDIKNPSPEAKEMIELAGVADQIIERQPLKSMISISRANVAFLVKRMLSKTIKHYEERKINLDQISKIFNETVLKKYSSKPFSLTEFPEKTSIEYYKKVWKQEIIAFKTMLILKNRDTKFKELPKDILYIILLEMNSKKILPGTLTSFEKAVKGMSFLRMENIVKLHAEVDDLLNKAGKGNLETRGIVFEEASSEDFKDDNWLVAELMKAEIDISLWGEQFELFPILGNFIKVTD